MGMADLITLSFPDSNGAERCLRALLPLEQEHLVKLTDLAWGMKKSNGKILSYHLQPTPFQSLLRGSLWGTLAGAMLLEPFFGMLVGGATALFVTSLRSDEGLISRAYIDATLRKKLEPGQSALFLMVNQATPDKLMSRLYEHPATIVATSLSQAKESRLREMWRKVRRDGPLALKSGRGPETQLLTQ